MQGRRPLPCLFSFFRIPGYKFPIVCYNIFYNRFERKDYPMAKKTAKSKGYRYYKKEKPFLTRKEIYALIAIAVLVLAAVIGFALYDDGALKVTDGAIEGAETNWIITNGGTTSSPRYFKLAEAGELEGYTMQPYLSYSDYLLHDVYYYATDESNPVDYISIGTTSVKNSTPADLGATVVDALKTMEDYTVTTELTEAAAGDVPYLYYAFTSETYVAPEDEETAEDETAVDAETEQEPNTFGQSLNAYVETAHDSCLLIHIINETESADEFLPDAELRAVMDQVVSALVLEKK